jgi:hypothetical protein
MTATGSTHQRFDISAEDWRDTVEASRLRVPAWRALTAGRGAETRVPAPASATLPTFARETDDERAPPEADARLAAVAPLRVFLGAMSP